MQPVPKECGNGYVENQSEHTGECAHYNLLISRTNYLNSQFQTYDILRRIGLCVSYGTVEAMLDTLVVGYDDLLEQWRDVSFDFATQTHLELIYLFDGTGHRRCLV